MCFRPSAAVGPAGVVGAVHFDQAPFYFQVMRQEMAVGDQEDLVGGNGTGVIVEKTKPVVKKPPLYKVLLLNDDYTPMDFVVVLLMRIFNMRQEKAEQIMLHIHTKGVGVCGVFPREIAETKMRQVIGFAQKYEHPLQCTMEKA